MEIVIDTIHENGLPSIEQEMYEDGAGPDITIEGTEEEFRTLIERLEKAITTQKISE